MRKKRDYASLILLLASLAVFAFAVWKLFCIYAEYHQGTETYEELQDYVQKPEENVNPSPSEDGTSEEGTQNDGEGYLQVDFEGLKKINPHGFRFLRWISAIRWYREMIITITCTICLTDRRIRTEVFLWIIIISQTLRTAIPSSMAII